MTVKKKIKKMAPEVGTTTYVRVLWKSEGNPNRYYCRIEDPSYEGDGWIDTYQKGGSIGMFHYDPMLDIGSFYNDGNPLIFKVILNSVCSPYEENRTYKFYLQEGTSTYPIKLPELIEIMKGRNFSQYNTTAPDLGKIEVTAQEPLTLTEEKKNVQKNKFTPLSDDKIATSSLRRNNVKNWEDDYGVETSCYLRIMNNGDWCVLDDIEWKTDFSPLPSMMTKPTATLW